MGSVNVCGFVLATLVTLGGTAPIFADDGKGGRAAPPADKSSVDELINGLRDNDIDKKLEALRGLQQLGPKAKAAIPDLISALRNKDARVQRGAIDALATIGPDAKEALPTLRLMLSEDKQGGNYHVYSLIYAVVQISPKFDLEITRAIVANSTLKSGESLVIGYLPKYAAELTPHLIILLDDIDVNVRVRVSQAFLRMTDPDQAKNTIIKQLGDKAKPIAPALLKHVDDSDPKAAAAAAVALTHVDPELGAKAIPQVIAWLKTGPKGFGDYTAAEILRPVAKAAIPALIDALDEKDAGNRGNIAATVALIEGSTEPLIKALEHENVLIRAGAAKALAFTYRRVSSVSTALVAALKDSERIVRFAAADALVWTGSERVREGVPVLIEVIRDGADEEQASAAGLLKRIGPSARAAVPDLIALLKDDGIGVRLEAALALTAIDVVSASKAVDALIEGTQSTKQFDQHHAAKALAEFGPPAIRAVPALEKLYEANYVHARYSAAEAVARIDPTRIESAVKVIVDTLKHKKNQSSMVRVYSLDSLRRIGPAAKSAIPALNEILKDDGPFHGEVALTAMCLDGENAKEAVKFIREHLGKDDEDSEDLIECLPKYSAQAKLFLPEIRQVLETSKNSYLQIQMCETIARIGPAAGDLAPSLKALIAKTKNKHLIECAEQAIVAIAAKK